MESARFDLPNRAPQVYIFTPSPAATFALGEAVHLRGVSFDPEDGLRGDATLHWSSDKQGPLGSGGEITVTNLVAGEHVITLAAADSVDAPASASVPVSVSNPPVLPPPAIAVQLEGNQVRLSWPAGAIGFALQLTETLQSPIPWQNYSGPVTQSGDLNSAALPVQSGNRYYRLHKPE